MTLDELCGRRVAIWGTGVEGRGMARLLLERSVIPTLVDDSAGGGARVQVTSDAELAVLAPGAVDWDRVDVVVRSPGVSRYRDELAAAARAGTVVTTAMALWLDDARGGPVLAVTGTKGKSTTASMAASVLEHEGLSVELVGNIGRPVTDLYGRPPADAVVVEVSSYQAADATVSPRVTVLTGLAPDHLDWHGGVERYYRDKLRLITAGPSGDLAVDAASAEAVARTAGHPRRILYGTDGRVRVGDGGAVEIDGGAVVDSDRLRVPGVHNVANLCGALAGVLLLRGEPPTRRAVEEAVDGYEGLPSRCRAVGERDGLTFVDDALASNPTATAASIAAFPGRPLTVILGGADRGVDPGPLVEAILGRRPRPAVVVMPPNAERLVDPLDTGPGTLRPIVADDLEGAVASAVSMTAPGGVVLFSPAAPTPPGEGGYRERSRRFGVAAGLVWSTIAGGGVGGADDGRAAR